MNRRKLLATSGAATLTAAAAVVAVGANFSLFGLTGGSADAGKLQPTDPTATTIEAPVPPAPIPEVIYLDVEDPAATAPGVGGPGSVPAPSDPDDSPDPRASVTSAPSAAPAASSSHADSNDDSNEIEHGFDGDEDDD
ncbi:MAG TPA: hypothetical protein VFF40_12885 [Acidimicrobiia bacterium]|nr:hypothetical protein [Acidimicrobiia bacterium]